MIWSAKGDYITSNFLKAASIFHNFTWSILEYVISYITRVFCRLYMLPISYHGLIWWYYMDAGTRCWPSKFAVIRNSCSQMKISQMKFCEVQMKIPVCENTCENTCFLVRFMNLSRTVFHKIPPGDWFYCMLSFS